MVLGAVVGSAQWVAYGMRKLHLDDLGEKAQFFQAKCNLGLGEKFFYPPTV